MRDSNPSSPVPAPDVPLRQALLSTLRDLERDPSGNASARRRLRAWLPDAPDPAAPSHLDLPELQALVRLRRERGAAFEVPEHLLECRVCMELFQVLCESAEVSRPSGTSTGGPIQDASLPATTTRSAPRPGFRRIAALAASVLLGLWLWGFLRSPDIILEDGNLQSRADILRDGRVPARKSLEALRRTRLRFLDGSRIELEPGARIRILKTPTLETRLRIEAGQARIDFREADSAPQLEFGEVNILPGSAAFEVSAGPEVNRLRVTRGTLRLRGPDGLQTLGEGENATWPR